MSDNRLPTYPEKVIRNDQGEVYFVHFKMVNPGQFLRAMWRAVDSVIYPQTDEVAAGEWTDRGRAVRSSTFGNQICIRTHAYSPRGDTRKLHADVLRVLAEMNVCIPESDGEK